MSTLAAVLPGERITLIKKIAERLAESDPEDIQLTLGQFGVAYKAHIDENFAFDSFRTVLQSIECARDDALLGLHAYLFGDAAPSPSGGSRASEALASFWAEEEFRLFLTHTSARKKEVGELQTFLHLEGVSGFVAHTDIEPTSEWQGVIETALGTCDALGAYMTPDFHQSLWTDQEVGFCVARAVLIVPIKMNQDPYGFIGKYQAVQGAGKTSSALSDEITDILVNPPADRPSHGSSRGQSVRVLPQLRQRTEEFRSAPANPGERVDARAIRNGDRSRTFEQSTE
jgi:hypothetical protein